MMNDDPELLKLYQNLDLTFAITQIADRCEELGFSDKAFAWRHIAEKKYYPLKRKTVYWWSMAFTGTSAPHKVEPWLRLLKNNIEWTTAKTIEQAYINLVQAYLESPKSAGCVANMPRSFIVHFRDQILLNYTDDDRCRRIIASF